MKTRLSILIIALALSALACSGGPKRCPVCGRIDCVCESTPAEPEQPTPEEPDTPVPQPTGSDFIILSNGKLIAPDGNEVRLWGVNFQTPISWEYNRLANVGVSKTAQGLNSVTDNNLDDVVRMGANHLRCHLTPADFTDASGHLVESSPYLDALDYLICEAEKRGVYVSFAFLNAMGSSGPGSAWVGQERGAWIQDPNRVKCMKTYIGELVSRTNKYSGKTYGQTQNIAYWELINEPEMYSYTSISGSSCYSHYKDWLQKNGKSDSSEAYALYREETVKDYINGLKATAREKGDHHLFCWGLNWHRYRRGNADLFKGVSESDIDIVAFCNYPGQDLVSQSYWNNTYNFDTQDFSSWFSDQRRDENGYGWALTSSFEKKAIVVYEFETFFNQSAYLYGVQATYFRSLRVQSASMWTYTFNEIAPFMGGSHYLNLNTTPAKAAAFLVASRIYSTAPYLTDFSSSPNEQKTDTYVVSKTHNGAIFCTEQEFIHSCPITEDWNPLPPGNDVMFVAGIGGDPLVEYSGTGLYFIEDTGEGLLMEFTPNIRVVGNIYSGATYANAKTILDRATKNSVKIHLPSWENRAGTLYRIDGKTRTSMGPVSGSGNLKLSSGKYILVPND